MGIFIPAVIGFVVALLVNLLIRRRREDVFFDRLGYVIRDAVIDAVKQSKKKND